MMSLGEHIGVLLFASIVPYLRVLNYSYIIDDQCVPKGYGRNFIETFWLRLTARAYSNCVVEHAQRIGVHAAVTCLMYLFFGSIFGQELSFLASLFFAVNPVNNNAVAWLNGVGYVMSTLLVLLICMSDHVIWATAFYIFTMWWHVTAFPVFLFVLAVPGHEVKVLIIWAYAIIAYICDLNIPFGKAQDDATLSNRMEKAKGGYKRLYFRKLIFVIKTYAYYFYLCLFPSRLGLYHTFGYDFALTQKGSDKWLTLSPLFWFGLGQIILNGYLIVEFWRTPLSMGLLWFSVFIAPFCNVIIMHQNISERYCYLPNIGLMVALAYTVFALFQYHAVLMISTAIFIGYLVKLCSYLPAYKDMETFIDYNLRDFPDNFAAWNWKGVLERDKNRLFSAMHYWAIGLRHQPDSFRINFNIAMVYKFLNQPEHAKVYLDQARRGLDEEIFKESLALMQEEEDELLTRIKGSHVPQGQEQARQIILPGDPRWLHKKMGRGKGGKKR